MEEEEDICRVCRNGATADNRLSYPCKCSGSIKFIHQQCLLEWIKHSKSSSCELCGYPFRFTPIYSENAPDVLPVKEFAVEMGIRLTRYLKRFIRILYATFCFLVVVPLMTCYTFHFYFGKTERISFDFSDPYTLFNTFFLGTLLFFWILAASVLSYLFIAYLSRKLSELDLEDRQLQQQLQQQQQQQDFDQEIDDEDDQGDEEDIVQQQQQPPQPQQHQVQHEVRQLFRIPGVIEILNIQEVPIQNIQDINVDHNQQPVDDDDDLEELFGLIGPWSEVLLRSGGFILYNSLFLFVFLYVPFIFGKSTIDLSFPQDFSKNLQLGTITEGLLSLFIGYFEFSLISLLILSILVYDKIAFKLARLLHSFIKISFLVVIELGIMPLIYGLFLDLLTLNLFGSKIDSRIEFFINNKIQYIITRLGFGLFAMVTISSCAKVLHQIFRPEILWFLKEVADPDLMLRKSFLSLFVSVIISFIIYCVIGILVIYLPIELLNSITTTLFPMDFGDIFNKFGTDICLIVLTSYFPRFHPQFTFNNFIHKTFTHIIKFVGIDDYMLIAPPPPPVEPGQPVAATEEKVYVKPKHFGLKFTGFVVLSWLELFGVMTLFISLPITIGRAMFLAVNITQQNDTFSMFVGVGILWCLIKLFYIVFYNRSTSGLFSKLPIVFKLFVLGFFIIIALPTLAGLVFELVIIIPLITSYDETYYIYLNDLFNVWGIGVFILNFWYQWVNSMTANNIRHNLPQDGVDQEGGERQANDRWVDRFNRLKRNGFTGVDFKFCMTKIIFPIAQFFLKLFTIPFFIAKGVVPLLGGSVLLENIVFLYGYPVFVLLIITERLIIKAKSWFIHLHNMIRDDRYLIGKHLHNLESNKIKSN